MTVLVRGGTRRALFGGDRLVLRGGSAIMVTPQEVMPDPVAVPIVVPAPTLTLAEFEIAMGTYTGDQVDDRTVTPLSFGAPPDVLFIKAASTTGAFVVRTNTMVGDKSGVLKPAGVLAADKIQSLVTDGWTLGVSVDVNSNLVVYAYLAIYDPNGQQVKCVSYVGDGNDNRDITGASFTPDIAIIIGDVNQLPVYRINEAVGDLSGTFTAVHAADMIQAFVSGGVTLGTSALVNASGSTYHVIFMKNLSGFIATTRYTGNGTDNRSIGGSDFTPQFALVHCVSGGNQDAVVRFKDNVGDLSQEIDSTRLADGIQAFEATGIQIGSGATIPVNTSGRLTLVIQRFAAVSCKHSVAE